MFAPERLVHVVVKGNLQSGVSGTILRCKLSWPRRSGRAPNLRWSVERKRVATRAAPTT